MAWAAAMADGVRESVLAEAAALEEEPGHSGGKGEVDVASGIATLSVTVRTIVLQFMRSSNHGRDSALATNSLSILAILAVSVGCKCPSDERWLGTQRCVFHRQNEPALLRIS